MWFQSAPEDQNAGQVQKIQKSSVQISQYFQLSGVKIITQFSCIRKENLVIFKVDSYCIVSEENNMLKSHIHYWILWLDEIYPYIVKTFSNQKSTMEIIKQKVEETSKESFLQSWGKIDPTTTSQIKCNWWAFCDTWFSRIGSK